jgi:hypothetical protein
VSVSDYVNLDQLPRLTDIRERRACPKGKTRLEVKAETKTLTTVDEKKFKTSVWHRDRNRCRCCGRKVIKTITVTAERGEVHHIHGRRGDLRFEPRAACLICLSCHQRVTGKVNANRLFVVASKTFTTTHGIFTDATFPITFREAP